MNILERANQVLNTAEAHLSETQQRGVQSDLAIKFEELRLKYEQGVLFNANELMTLAQMELQRAKNRVTMVEGRVARARDRLARKGGRRRQESRNQ